jgi:hypothetical protein
MSEQIQIVTKRVGLPVQFEIIEHTLENMQKIVGGTLDSVRVREDIIMWVDDEGLLKESPLNLITYVDGKEVHHIAGDVFFAGIDDEGETISLTDEQIAWITNRFQIIGKAKDKKGNKYFVFGLFVK